MAIKGYMESSLATSKIFNQINEINKDSIVSVAKKLIENGKHLHSTDIETAYISVKQISDSLTVEALKAFDNGKIVLVYTDQIKMVMSETIPFLTFKKQDKYITYVFINRYITVSRDGVLNLQPSIFRDLLIGALIANSLKYNYTNMASSQYLTKTLMKIYTQLFTRIINRNYSITADKVTYEAVQYYINKFFLYIVFNSLDTEENIEQICRKHFNYSNEMQVEKLFNRYEEVKPTDVETLLSLLSELSPRMSNINISTFISSWVSYYHAPVLLAVDNIEYLLFMILTLLSGNNIANISASDIIKETRGIKDLKAELLKLV